MEKINLNISAALENLARQRATDAFLKKCQNMEPKKWDPERPSLWDKNLDDLTKNPFIQKKN